MNTNIYIELESFRRWRRHARRIKVEFEFIALTPEAIVEVVAPRCGHRIAHSIYKTNSVATATFTFEKSHAGCRLLGSGKCNHQSDQKESCSLHIDECLFLVDCRMVETCA
tara:strand:+ start:435 stop:767 length:333 start_codon:yes stop_codon:yes gene_type:complete